MVKLEISAKHIAHRREISPFALLTMRLALVFMNLISYLQEVKSEMSRVTWPNRKQVLDLTVLVIAISIIVGVYVGGLDFVFTNVLNKVLGR